MTVRAADRDRVYDLGYVLHNIERFSWSDDLYLPPDQPWEERTPCAVLDTSELDEGEEPELARSLGLAYALTVQDVRGIVGNVRELVPQPTTGQLLAALKYYYEHDAFIDDASLRRAGAPQPPE